MKITFLKWTVHIFTTAQSSAERARKFYKNRRDKSLCASCAAEPDLNKKTGKLYKKMQKMQKKRMLPSKDQA